MIQGNFVLLQDVSPCKGNPDPPPRGKCTGFSKSARKRMIRECARLGNSIPVFVTLTYPDKWPAAPGEWKKHLDTWWKRVRRSQPDLSAIWRLEPQERGAPHYHLLVYRKSGKRPFLPHSWVSETWADITDGNPAACSRVEALESHRGGMFYAAKYCAKLGDGTLPEGWEHVGKHWGKLSASDLPFPAQYEMLLHSGMEQAAALFAMSDAYKNAFIASAAKANEDAGEDPKTALTIARMDWETMKKDNEFLGNTTAFFGTGEEFLERLSFKMGELTDYLSNLTGRHAAEFRKKLDIELTLL